MDLTSLRPIAETLFADIRELSFDGVGVTRESYGPRENAAAEYLRRFANEAGRDVWIVPNRPGTPNSGGVLALLKDGARPMFDIDEFVSELVEELRWTHPVEPPPVPDRLRELLRAVACEPAVSPSELCRTLSWPALKVSSGLTELELLGVVGRRLNGEWELALPYSGT